MQKRHDPERREPAFTYIVEEVDRLNRIVSNYLSLGSTRAVAGEVIDLQELVREIVDGPGLAVAGNLVETSVSLEGLPRIAGNRMELRQVFLNLLLNSVQAQPSGGRIEVSGDVANRDGRPWVRVVIADHGPGIAEHALRRVFEPFYTTREKGSGLGLFVVRRVVEAHGGKVTLSSRKGQGTKAEVVLPLGQLGPDAG
jgi:two-component system sensor histidine kinase AtoS